MRGSKRANAWLLNERAHRGGELERAERKSGRIKSVEVGYRVLLAVQMGPGSVRLSDVARRSGLSTGAAHNYLVSLVRTGLVEQDARGSYRLGPSAFALSLASFRQLNGYDVLKAEADALHQLTKQITSVSVWSQAGPVSIYIQRGENSARYAFRPGLIPMLVSGAGPIFIAYLPEQETRNLLARELAETGSARDIDEVLRSTRETIRSKGYARVDFENGSIYALSVPVWAQDKRIIFALSIIIDSPVQPKHEAQWLNELLASSHRASLLLADCSSPNTPAPLDTRILTTEC